MEFLLDPNVTYLILVGGLSLAILGLLTPGTGVIEAGAMLLLLVAGYAIYSIPINPWALVVLIVGVIPFVLAVRKSHQKRYLVVAVLALVIGSAYLFQSDAWWKPAVHPLVALVVSILVGVFFWFITIKSLEAMDKKPVFDLESLVGAEGETRTVVEMEGSVYVAGEMWSARCAQRLPPNTPIRVVKRNGFMLEVEPLKPVQH
ncbi:MAG TPA: NfeD family protein [Anaerolineaceae bacterium]|nr:NfeD family protein [Anaerolineaceae bacterium]HPN51306.1 NfeD family protein [Anaerolineaceae bacterium]